MYYFLTVESESYAAYLAVLGLSIVIKEHIELLQAFIFQFINSMARHTRFPYGEIFNDIQLNNVFSPHLFNMNKPVTQFRF